MPIVGCVQHDCPECQARIEKEAKKLMVKTIRNELGRMRLDIQQMMDLLEHHPKSRYIKRDLRSLVEQYEDFCCFHGMQ